jgi:hypothetical protein
MTDGITIRSSAQGWWICTKTMDALTLFPDGALDARSRGPDACVAPIGRYGIGHRRRARSARPRRPSTAAVLSEIRSFMRDELGNVSATLRRIERGARAQLDVQSVTNDQLERVLIRLVRLERALGVIEQPQTPHVRRRRPSDS